MTVDDKARDLLERLSLPDDAPRVLTDPRYWNVDFCRLYLERSEEIRFENPDAGLRTAEVAPGLAYRVPKHQCGGATAWSSLQLDALGLTGSAYRTVTALEVAEQVFLIAALLFADSADEVAVARFIRRTAYLRAAQGRFSEAEELVEEAIEAYCSLGLRHSLGCALVDRGVLYGRDRQFNLAARDLYEALDHLEDGRDPRYQYSAVHNLAYALLKRDNADPHEAMKWIARARELNHEPPTSLSQTKLLWMEGEASAMTGDAAEAKATLGRVHRQLLKLGAVLDAALAGIELAEVCFRTGDATEVLRLAGRLFPLFRSLRNDQDAFDALKLFHRAALAGTLSTKVFESVKTALGKRRGHP